jgi:hypothetical protein
MANVSGRNGTPLELELLAKSLACSFEYSGQGAQWAVCSVGAVALDIVDQNKTIITLRADFRIVGKSEVTVLNELLADSILQN